LIKGTNSFKKTYSCLLCLTAVLATPATYAGDEDMSPNAYHIFDPETGYMITVESLPDGQQALAEADANSTADPLKDQAEDAIQNQTWIYLIAAILLAGGFAGWRRNKDKIKISTLD